MPSDPEHSDADPAIFGPRPFTHRHRRRGSKTGRRAGILILTPLVAWASAAVLLAGCGSRSNPTPGASPAAGDAPAEITDAAVVRARYSRGRSPCVPLGGGRRAWFRVDDFRVVEVLAGRADVEHIKVRPNTW